MIKRKEEREGKKEKWTNDKWTKKKEKKREQGRRKRRKIEDKLSS